jgi:tetratricopeptide (TPR) repeat protein
VAVCLLVCPLAGRISASDLETEAREAFEAGNRPLALALYDAVLASDPGDLEALFRSGQILSWDRRYAEAIARYDRLLAIDANRRDAAIERAKVLSWDRRFSDAERAFREVLRRWPEERDARLGLARTLSWRGKESAARAEYARVLEADPRNVAAQIGTAQTWAWSGRLAQARGSYERALALSPDDRDAWLGLAYVNLWSGDPASAHEIASELARQYPADDEVDALHERTLLATRPSIRGTFDRIEDTDDNELSIATLGAGIALDRRVDLILGLARYDMRDPTGDATIDGASAGVDLRVAPGHLVSLRLGADRLESTSGERTTEPTGLAAWSFGIDRAWRGSVTAARETLRYSPAITDAGIVIDGFRAEGSGRIGDVWRVSGATSFGDYSDGNSRSQLDLGFRGRLPVRRVQVEAGVSLSGIDFDEDLDNGYFDPSDFRSALGVVRATDTFGRRDASWSVEGSGGVQSFTASGVDVDRDRVFVVSGTVSLPLGRAVRLDLRVSRGDYAAQTPAGFESWQAGLSLRIAVF